MFLFSWSDNLSFTIKIWNYCTVYEFNTRVCTVLTSIKMIYSVVKPAVPWRAESGCVQNARVVTCRTHAHTHATHLKVYCRSWDLSQLSLKDKTRITLPSNDHVQALLSRLYQRRYIQLMKSGFWTKYSGSISLHYVLDCDA